MKTKNNKLKITLILKKESKKHFLYPSVRKMQNFLRSEAVSYLKKGFLITIRVSYGCGINVKGERVIFKNEGTYKSVNDLKWAFGAFVRGYL